MTFSKTVAFVGLLLLVPFKLAAADAPSTIFKVAFVDLQRALQTVEAGKKAKTLLEKRVTAKREEIEKLQATLQKEFEQFEKKAAILNDSAKAQKQQELQKRYMELQKNYADSQQELQKEERELMKPLIEEFRSVVEGIGKEKGYQLIVEKNEGAVLYAEAGADLTEVVIEKFNARKKKK